MFPLKTLRSRFTRTAFATLTSTALLLGMAQAPANATPLSTTDYRSTVASTSSSNALASKAKTAENPNDPTFLPTAEAGFVTSADGTRISYYQYGKKVTEAPTIVITGTWPWDAQVFNPLVRLLAQTYHVVQYDQRGYGKSGKPLPISAYTLDKLAADFGAVIDKTAPHKRVHVVGVEWGPYAFSEYNQSHKGRIASFTSLGSPSIDINATCAKADITSSDKAEQKPPASTTPPASSSTDWPTYPSSPPPSCSPECPPWLLTPSPTNSPENGTHTSKATKCTTA